MIAPPLPLRHLIPLLLLVLAAVTGVSSYFFFSAIGTVQVRDEVTRQAHRVMDILQSSVDSALRRDERATVRQIFKSLGKDEEVIGVALVDHQGTVILSARRDWQNKSLESLPVDTLKTLHEKVQKTRGGMIEVDIAAQRLVAVYPVLLPDPGAILSQRVGSVLMVKSIANRMQYESYEQERHVLFLVIVLATLGLLLWRVFHGAIAKRVARLVTASQKIAGGDMDVRVELAGRDELAELADAFNHMVERLALQRQHLQDSQERLQRSQLAANLGSWEWDIPSDVIRWTQMVPVLFGIETDSAVNHGATLLAAIHPQDRALVEAAIQSCVERAEPLDVEFRVTGREGRIRWLSLQGNVGHRPGQLLGVVRDVTMRRETEQELRHALGELNFQKYAQDLHCIVTITDREGVIRYVNDHFCSISGYSRDELVGNTHAMLRSGGQGAAFYEEMWATVAAGNIWRGEFCNRNKGGDIYWLDMTIVPHLDESGQVDRFVGISTDVTARKQAEHALENDKTFLERVLNSLHEGVMVCDSAGVVTFMNDASQAMTTTSMVGLSIHERESYRQYFKLRSKLSNEEACPLLSLLQGEDVEDLELLLENQVGKHYRVAVNGTRLLDRDGRLTGAMISISDLTDIQTMAERLRQAQKMEAIGQLTGGIAHDFNNMLASIMGYTELSLNRLGDDADPKLNSYLRNVYTASERARDLIQQMLLFSRRGDMAQGEISPEPVIKEVAKLLRSTLPTSIEIDLAVEKGLGQIRIDPVQFHQVVMNLAINARDALGGKGVIRIELRAENVNERQCSACQAAFSGRYLVLSVSDDGAGMSEEVRSRIFEPFFTTKGVGKGTGMGLSVVHGILHEVDGHVLVDSRPGRGTRISCLFPMQVPKEPGEGDVDATLQRLERSAGSSSACIMVVDDEESLVILEKEVLELNGYQVETHTDSLAALAAFQQAPERFDAVITDQTMPQMTGMELADALLAIRSDVPVILATGYSESVGETEVLAAGLRGYLTKPLDIPRLLELLESVVNRRAQ